MSHSLCSSLSQLPRIAAASLALAASAAGQQPRQSEIEMIPSGPVSLDERTGEIVATEGAQILYDTWILSADTIRYNQQTGRAEAVGNVIFSREELRLVADYLLYQPRQQFARVENFRAGNGLIYVDGSVLEGNPDNFRFEDVNFYPGEPGTFLFEARAGELALENQNVARGRRLFFKVGPVPFLLIPNITQPLDAETNLFRPQLDYSGHIGASIGAEALAPVNRHLRLGANFALTSDRGALFGPAARYTIDGGGSTGSGSFISGYIDDTGEPGVDLLGRLIDNDRYFAEWRHRQEWGENRISLSAYGRYWSDSEVTRDFYEESFDRMQDPNSFLEANYNGANWQLGLYAQAALNDFQFQTERLPELRFAYFPTPLAAGFTHSGFIAASRLDQDFEPFATDSEATRLDAFYGIRYDRPLREGVTLGLKAGARTIRYDDAIGLSGFGSTTDANGGQQIDFSNPITYELDGLQAFGEFGLDLGLKAFSEIAFEDETWNIRGLRHIVEPRLAYRWTPELDIGDGLGGRAEFDRRVFGSYLPDIDLEDRRDVDSLAEDHKLRFELKNRIQTRHRDGGSRNLARVDLAADYHLPGAYDRENDFSLLHLDLELTPADWLAMNAFTRLDPEDSFSEKETSVAFAIQDPGYWRVTFGTHFLSGRSGQALRSLNPADSTLPFSYPNAFGNPHYFPQSSDLSRLLSSPYSLINADNNLRLEQYFASIEYYLSENLKLYATTRYDDESGVFYEQRVGLMQRALERYALKYEFRFYDGDRREKDFGISLGIDLFDSL